MWVGPALAVPAYAQPKDAEPVTRDANAAVLKTLPFVLGFEVHDA